MVGTHTAQANVNPTLPEKEWPLEALAAKLKQYCNLMTDLTPELLRAEAGGDYEALRAYLRRRGVEAYWKKARCLDVPTPSYAWCSAGSWRQRGPCALFECLPSWRCCSGTTDPAGFLKAQLLGLVG